MKFRTKRRRQAIRELPMTPTVNTASDEGGSSVKMSWVHACVNVAVREAEARLRAEAEKRDRQSLSTNGEIPERERIMLTAIGDEIKEEVDKLQKQIDIVANRQQEAVVNQQAVDPTAFKMLETRTGLAVDALEEKVNSLQAEIAELRQALMKQTRPPRKLRILHGDGSESVISEEAVKPDTGKEEEDFLPPPQSASESKSPR